MVQSPAVRAKTEACSPSTGNGTVHPDALLPPLESGDRLSRAEFERRYNARPDIKKAELIEGVVYVASSVRMKQHGIPHQRISTWIGLYCVETPGVLAGDNATLRLDSDNEPQPDISVWIEVFGLTKDWAGKPRSVMTITWKALLNC